MKLNRRHAIFASMAVAGAGAFKASASTVTRPATAFGTTVRLTVAASSSAEAEHAIDASYQEIRAIEKVFNLFDPGSEISRLNASGWLNRPSELMLALVGLSRHYWSLTNGAFDPTVQPLWQTWAKAAGQHDVPGAMELQAQALRVGWQDVRAQPDTISFGRNGMGVTFNGIAQGFAANRVLTSLRAIGVQSATIDTGEFGISHEHSSGNSRFAVVNPRQPESPLGFISIPQGFISTSGDYASNFTPDFLHHHIFDPAMGRSPTELSSVVVIADEGAKADALSTAFMVMGKNRSLELAQTLPSVEVLLVDKSGVVSMTPGMMKHFSET